MIIGGGSWYGECDEYAQVYLSDMSRLLLSSLQNPKGHVRMLGIGLFHQILMGGLGRMIDPECPPIVPFSGSLECGYTPLRVRAPNHPILRGMPKALSVVGLHDTHILVRPDQEELLKKNFGVQRLARSGLTGLPIAHEAFF